MKINPILSDILSENQQRRSAAFRQLYKECFPWVRNYVFTNNGDLEEAKDLFQDTLTTMYHNLLENKFRGESSLSSYVYAIAKNLWLMKLRKQKMETKMQTTHEEIENDNNIVNHSLLNHVLDHLNDGCKKLLKSFYYESRNMSEIAEIFELGSTQAAKTKKHRCMKRLSEIVEKFNLDRDRFLT